MDLNNNSNNNLNNNLIDDLSDDFNDGGTYSPEELAWKLIMDENVSDGALVGYVDEDSNEVLFEILITIYIEMIFNYYKLKYLESTIKDDKDEDEDEDEDEEDDNDIINRFDNFKLDLTNINIDNLTNIFSEKMKKIKYNLFVSELSQTQYDYIKQKRYCNVLLKDSPIDKTYFIKNEKYLDPEKNYHFTINSLYQKNKNDLRDIYCTANINQKYFKIYFTKI